MVMVIVMVMIMGKVRGLVRSRGYRSGLCEA